MFASVLVANRGEIAVRIQRTLRRLGIRSVAVYSDADAGARHALEADVALRLGAEPRTSYLDVERIVEVAQRAGAEALHPGYGFLAESAALADACAGAGITFVGPPTSAIAAMGDKVRARETVAAAGVPVVPGRGGPGLSDADLATAALEVGLPVIVKPSAGGGGKGMRVVTAETELAAALSAARREALASFGDDTLLVERFVARPRHIEIQVLADHHGNVVHLGERECSLQRRHQKIVEECPSPFVADDVRAAMGAQAVAVARACSYTNAGTVELIVAGDDPRDFFFMEMNTRLQVEHPVTEAVYGIDLVELQLRIAAGEEKPWGDALLRRGHAVEARLCAEDPDDGFLPTGGVVGRLREPTGPGIRIDSALLSGTVVGSDFDPMLAKVVAHGADRAEAIEMLRGALRDTLVLGVTTNARFVHDLLALPDVRAGRLDTGLVERTPSSTPPVPSEVVLVAWLLELDTGARRDLWRTPHGWRLGGAAPLSGVVEVDDVAHIVLVRRDGDGWEAVVDGGAADHVAIDHVGDQVVVRSSTGLVRFEVWSDGDDVWLGQDGRTWRATVADRSRLSVGAGRAAAEGSVTSPMPGLVVDVHVAAGDHVVVGQAVAIVEAMKMEHTLVAPIDGVIAEVHAVSGAHVARRAPIVTVAPKTEEDAA